MPYEVKGDLHCWIWTGYTTPSGHPIVRTATTSRSVRQRNWERENGPLPPGHRLVPVCGERLCVRPHHLQPLDPQTFAKYTGRQKRNPQLDRAALKLRGQGVSRRETARRLGISARAVEIIEQEVTHESE